MCARYFQNRKPNQAQSKAVFRTKHQNSMEASPAKEGKHKIKHLYKYSG